MYANFENSVIQVKFNHEEFRADMNNILNEALKVYIKTLLENIVKGELIPVYSGMAQGALLALGDLVNHHWAISSVYRKSSSGTDIKVTNKSAAGKALSSAHFTDTSSRGSIGKAFKFHTDVQHFVENESKHSNKKLKHPTPWNAFAKSKGVAQQAARDYIYQRVKLKSYIRVNKGRLTSSFK